MSHGFATKIIPVQLSQASGAPNAPSSRANAIVAQGVEQHGCRESREGQGRPLAADPWSDDGGSGPRRSRGRMVGQAFLLTFVRGAQPRLKKVSRPAGRNKSIPKDDNELNNRFYRKPVFTYPLSYARSNASLSVRTTFTRANLLSLASTSVQGAMAVLVWTTMSLTAWL